MRQATQFAARLSRDAAGNILPIAAIGLLVGALIIGSAVDLGRTYLAEEQLQSACDAGVLAGRRAVTTNGFDATAKAAAKAFFNTNYNDNAQTTRATTFDPVSTDDGNTVTAVATTVLDTLLMRVFLKDSFNISVSCGSSMGVGNADVMMVLDTTGSMGNALSGSTRIAALRTAMKNFYTTMSNATTGSNARVRYGFVPFSSSVNVGRLLTDLDTRYIVDSRSYQSRIYEPDDTGDNDTTSVWTLSSSTSYSSSNCDNKVPTDNTVTETGSGATKQQRRIEYACRQSGSKYYVYWRYVYRPYIMRYRQVEYDVSGFKTFASTGTPTGSYGANQNSTWGGCIEERSTVNQSSFSYSSTAGITPKTALDLDLDSLPDVTNDKTKWAPMLPQITYRRWNSRGNYTTSSPMYDGELGGTYCPVASRLLGEMTQTSFNQYADSLTAVGGTYLDIGMIWGGRLASPQGMWKGLVNDDPANGGEVARHIIFMTDGEMEPNAYIPQAWGMEYWDRRVTTDGSTGDTARHTARFLATCEAIKDKGIRVWVVAFTSGLSDDLKSCASDNSSYVASSATDLNTAFQEIAKQVGELRVVQ